MYSSSPCSPASSPSYTQSPADLHINEILTRKSLGLHFYRFMCEQHDEEVMDFLFAIDSFEHCQAQDAEVIAQQIIQLYILPNAAKELNFSGSARASFMMDMGRNQYMSFLHCHEDIDLLDRTSVFKKLKTRVKIQLQEEKVPIFLKSVHYENYLRSRRNRKSRSSTKMKRMSTIFRLSDATSPVDNGTGTHVNRTASPCENKNSNNWFTKLGFLLGKSKKQKTKECKTLGRPRSKTSAESDSKQESEDQEEPFQKTARMSIRWTEKERFVHPVVRRITS